MSELLPHRLRPGGRPSQARARALAGIPDPDLRADVLAALAEVVAARANGTPLSFEVTGNEQGEFFVRIFEERSFMRH